ncbi:MAG: hypothetical protein D6715_12045 [Calditrichaeota bacterium]|nr:MAG: hypothetical protein D6715_12045 [Calditrichota bacterium]
MLTATSHRFFRLLAIVWAGLLAGCGNLVPINIPYAQIEADPESWTMLGGNPQHTHSISYDVAPPLNIAWKKSVPSVVTDHPLAAGGYLFLTTYNGMLFTLNVSSRDVLAKGRFGPSLIHVPALYKSLLFAGMNIGKKTLIAYDLSQAKAVLQGEYPPVTTAPLIDQNRVYFGTYAGLFFCATAGTAKELWRYKAARSIHSSPALQGRRLFFGDDAGFVYALEARHGRELWKHPFNGSVFVHPVISDSTVFIGTVAGELAALDVQTGKVRWQLSLDGSIYGGPSVFGNDLYLGTNAHQVLAVDKHTGTIRWQFQTEGIVNTVPLASPNYLYVTCWDGRLYVLDRHSGELVDEQAFSRPLKSSPIIYQNLIFIHIANKQLVALEGKPSILSRDDRP